MTSKKRIFLDASAWVALLEDYPQAVEVERALEESSEIFTSLISFYEVLLWYQNRKPQLVEKIASHLKTHSSLISIDEYVVWDALRLKQLYPRFSMADAISFATARNLTAIFVTTDSDFENVKGAVHIRQKHT